MYTFDDITTGDIALMSLNDMEKNLRKQITEEVINDVLSILEDASLKKAIDNGNEGHEIESESCYALYDVIKHAKAKYKNEKENYGGINNGKKHTTTRLS